MSARYTITKELAPRQREALGLVREGLTDRQIAERMSVSLNTVKQHLTNVYARLGASGRQHAVQLVFGGDER